MVVGNLNASEGCDVVVVGGGPGGYLCAIRAAQLGLDVILVEKRKALGGVCLNEGCIPSKAIIHAGETFEQMQHAETMGLMLPGAPSVDMKALQSWKAGIVKRLTGGVASLSKMNGVRVFEGHARFTDAHKLEIEGERPVSVDFSHAVIATGSVPLKLPPVPHDGEWVIGSKEALDLDRVPKHMVVIGGGYIGLELGMSYRKLGAKVTVVELQKELLGGSLEPEINRLLLKRTRALGIEVLLEHKAVEAAKSSGKLFVEDADGQRKELETDCVLVSIGRRPTTDGLGLEQLGLSTDDAGFLVVDEERRTAIPHIFAIGDVAGQPMLAHKAYREAKVAAEVIAGHPAAYDVRVCPAVMFTDPEIATVGMTEAEAKAAGYEVRTGVFPWSALGRAMTLGHVEGLCKVVADAQTDRLLGIHIAGPHAAELLGEGTLALELDAFLDDIGNTIHAHPTLSESLLEAAELALGTCAHYKN